MSDVKSLAQILASLTGWVIIGVSLWFLSVLALTGAISLFVLRPSLVSTSKSAAPSEQLQHCPETRGQNIDGGECLTDTTLSY